MAMDKARMDSLKGSRFEETACSADTHTSYSIDTCLWAGKTKYSDVVIAKSPIYGKILFTDGELQSAETDERIYHEFLVHPIINSTSNINDKRVLIVGGGEGATAREVLRWPPGQVKEVVWVDIDQELVDLSRKYLKFAPDATYNDPRCTFQCADIRKFLAENTKPFDIIILDLPDPDVEYLRENDASDEEYELYSSEFWKMVKKNLTATGQFVTHTGPIAPGKDFSKWKGGLEWINKHASVPLSTAYHINVPSFQSEWGFWMSLPPSHIGRFPKDVTVIDTYCQMQAFGWPTYWFQL